MTVSRLRLRLPKSESRLIVEREAERMRTVETEAWRMSDSTFFTAFVALAAAIAAAALLLR
jgi:hypothetical protein